MAISTAEGFLEKLPAGSLDAVIARLGALAVAGISDAMDQLGLPSSLIDSGIVRKTGRRMAGRARTIDRAQQPANARQEEIAPDLDWAPQVLWDDATPGDVVVMAIRGDVSVGCIGANTATRALMRGVAGAVIDGAVRDVDAISEIGLTVFARASSPRAAFGRLVTLSLNQPIICGGVYVRPGDVVIGDADGVVVVPAANAAEVADYAEAIEARGLNCKEFIEAGNTLIEAVQKYKFS